MREGKKDERWGMGGGNGGREGGYVRSGFSEKKEPSWATRAMWLT